MKILESDTDSEWERLGVEDPYYGVVTHEKNRRKNLTGDIRSDFFKSGEDHISHVMKIIHNSFDRNFHPIRALDFGCGVGRLTIPIAKISGNVVGIDVSESMLKEAQLNCGKTGIENVVFVKSDDAMSGLSGAFDFIHSFIVFQHIPIKRGIRIFRRLLKHLQAGGICVLHFTYAKESTKRKIVGYIKRYIPLARNVMSLIRERDFFAPQMEMNSYDLNEVLKLIQMNGITGLWTEFTSHGGELGVVIYFRKPTENQKLDQV